jgi:prepilin-type N-terminal cleavage/methylation domain-containing protein
MAGNELMEKVKNKGVTLMEMMVSMGIFALALTLAASIFVSSNRLQRKISLEQAVENEMRFALERFARTLRGGYIDYASYPQGTIPSNVQSTINLLDFAGKSVTFGQNTGAFALKEEGGAFSNLTSPQVKVADLKFYITPLKDPLLDTSMMTQPRVTMVLEALSAKPTTTPTKIRLQTTISARRYR